ncbi:cytidine deaminase-like protein [Pelagophyceae sp. CCMP2097]|nr:cytidine deaminase-like protein [Pelagophyceae sp. CCMP2097]
MRRALEEGEGALRDGEVPVGCVFVVDGVEVARGGNRTNADMCATRHAELVAVDAAPRDVKWHQADLYVTCEPCIMCASALAQLGVKRVFFGCRNDKFGGCGSILHLHAGKYDVVEGLGADEAVALFRRFYNRQNERTVDTALQKRRRTSSPEAPAAAPPGASTAVSTAADGGASQNRPACACQ